MPSRIGERRVRSCPDACRSRPSPVRRSRLHPRIRKPIVMRGRAMTIHIDARDIAGLSFRAPKPFAAARDLVIAGARAGWERFLEGLHKSRRQHAAIELAKHRYLIYDPTTGVAFGIDMPARAFAPPE